MSDIILSPHKVYCDDKRVAHGWVDETLMDLYIDAVWEEREQCQQAYDVERRCQYALRKMNYPVKIYDEPPRRIMDDRVARALGPIDG